MAQEFFSFAKLATLDGGRIQTAMDLELERVRLDCEDRPALKTARTITLTISMEPRATDEGDLFDVRMTSFVKASIPKRQTRSYRLAAGRGALVINELSPEDARQMTIDHLSAQPIPPPKDAAHAG